MNSQKSGKKPAELVNPSLSRVGNRLVLKDLNLACSYVFGKEEGGRFPFLFKIGKSAELLVEQPNGSISSADFEELCRFVSQNVKVLSKLEANEALARVRNACEREEDRNKLKVDGKIKVGKTGEAIELDFLAFRIEGDGRLIVVPKIGTFLSAGKAWFEVWDGSPKEKVVEALKPAIVKVKSDAPPDVKAFEVIDGGVVVTASAPAQSF
ncbi:MAG: hypothetical protein QXH27_04655 [Candidatus Micrarchaeia archaeon]